MNPRRSRPLVAKHERFAREYAASALEHSIQPRLELADHLAGGVDRDRKADADIAAAPGGLDLRVDADHLPSRVDQRATDGDDLPFNTSLRTPSASSAV